MTFKQLMSFAKLPKLELHAGKKALDRSATQRLGLQSAS